MIDSPKCHAGERIMISYSRAIAEKEFWKKCLQIARSNPKICAEEVEFRATLSKIGLGLQES